MQEFFKSKKVLIFGGTSSTRAYLRTVFKELGVEGSSIFSAMEYSQAMETVKEKQPEIMFLDFKVSNKTCLPLIDEHVKIYPNRFETLVLTMGLGGIFPDHSSSKDKGSDIFIQKPISQELISTSLKNWYEYRLNHLPNIKALGAVKEKYNQNDINSTFQLIEHCLLEGLYEPELFFIKGKILIENGKKDEALEVFHQGLELDKGNYYCLKGVYQLLNEKKEYAKAFDYVKPFIKNHPIDPVEIPELTKTFIAKQKFEEFIDFSEKYISLDNFDLMKEVDPEEVVDKSVFDETTQRIAISLLACGKFLRTQNKEDKARKSLIQASTLCGDNTKLLAQVTNELLELGEKEELDKIFKKIPSEMITAELEVVKFLLDMEIYNDAEALKFGLQLLNEGAKDYRIFEQVLVRSMRLKRRADFIEDIARDAIKHCPEHENNFSRFLRKSA
ncbi:MAG: hypothetical protein EP319_07505 [Deltaproteobacteria bacterium]|nr:MAG: hypothetical protein EP319_07505 [Deltaproteobacteria bacterium]